MDMDASLDMSLDASAAAQPFVTQYLDASKLRELTNIEFRIIYAFYQKKNDLQNADKIKISKIIIQHLLEKNLNFELNKNDFIFLSSAICEVFPSEIEDEYYTCSVYGQRPSGKLYDAFSNYRRLLGSCGLITRRRQKKKERKSIGATIEADSYEDFNFVKESTGSFNVLVEKWKNCFALRRKILEDEEVKTAEFLEREYLSQFQIFLQNDNNILKLFFEDAKTLHPKMRSHITWDICDSVIEKAKQKVKNRKVSKWISESERGDDGVKTAVSLLLLPYLFPSVRTRSSKDKKSFKVSKLEIQENFILFFETKDEAEEHEKNESMFSCELYPRVIFIGPLWKLTIYVTLLDKKYYCKDPLEAIEQCFFMYQALNLKYPAESTVVWNFMQIYFFNVRTKSDLNSSIIKSIRHSLGNEPRSTSTSVAETSIKEEEIDL